MAELTKKQINDVNIAIQKIADTGLHTNPISDAENQERKELVENFEYELHTLINNFSEKAEEIGGYYRSPAIKAELKDVLRNSLLKAHAALK